MESIENKLLQKIELNTIFTQVYWDTCTCIIVIETRERV